MPRPLMPSLFCCCFISLAGWDAFPKVGSNFSGLFPQDTSVPLPSQTKKKAAMCQDHMTHCKMQGRSPHCLKCVQAAAVIWVGADVRPPRALQIIKILTVSVLPQL